MFFRILNISLTYVLMLQSFAKEIYFLLNKRIAVWLSATGRLDCIKLD